MDEFGFLLDNPILIKHARSRLRVWQVAPMAAVVLVGGVCVVYGGHQIYWVGDAAAVTILLGIQMFILAFGGTNQINASLGGARESGILDFHRVSPLPPSVVALGFFLGAPVREYTLAAVLVPCTLFSATFLDAAGPWGGVSVVALLEVALLTSTWVVHALAMIGCLTRKKPRGSIVGSILTVIVLLFFAYLGSLGVYFGTRWFIQEERTMNLFGFMVPWLPWLLIYQACALGFLGLAVSRKMRAERAHSYSKPQALACMATLSVLLVGGVWGIARHLPVIPPSDPTPADAIMIASIYGLSFSAMILAVTVTPDAGEYVKGVRRAERAGARRPSAWSDAGSNRVALVGLCAMVLLAATAVVYVVGKQPVTDRMSLSWNVVNGQVRMTRVDLPPGDDVYSDDRQWLMSRQSYTSRPIAVGVLTLAYFGLGLQYFSIKTRKSGAVLMTLFLFIVWLLPMLGGAVVGMSGPDQDRALTFLSASPLVGIAMSSGLGTPPGIDAIRLAALAPPIAFAFAFNSLLVMTQRKVDRLLRANQKLPAPGKPEAKTPDAESP